MNIAQVDFEEIIDKSFIADGELSKSTIEKMLNFDGSPNCFDAPPIVWDVIDVLIDLNYKVFIDDQKRRPKPEQLVYLRFYFHKLNGQLSINSVGTKRK